MGSAAPKQLVFLTGGSGFIASHILEQLLSNDYRVIVTVRSALKGDKIISSFPEDTRKDISYEIIEDIAQDGAYDEAIKSNPSIDYVIHTASPYHHNLQDPVKDFLDPAIKGTTGILHSILKYAPTSVKRVLLLSSTATILNPSNHAKVYTEEIYGTTTWEEAIGGPLTYRASKIYSERAAFEFIEKEKPAFDLVTLNPSLVFGPPPKHLASLDALNTSNHRLRDMILGKMRENIAPTGPVHIFVDVRDVATAHIRALQIPQASMQRFMIVSDYFSNKRIADTIRERYPQLKDILPAEDSLDDFPESIYGFDVSKSKKMLGIEYRDLKTCVNDAVEAMISQV
ncbi:putative NAD dependent epimerase/dehydratase [Talaromyces proteolyticus]|uniref:NAD dependent epimerase/dehydratase n=1 Tax=Talaromyces proteolyticus TaxID=1131652 RepID=A0AAD4KIF5_9EURO|nr:putative NAD dependent epimerase/dehydratase [Talaromyces proteolyticus]KAH8691972.1 putative NAD dependent epimerase/dehydratase [Talaromyces proteolyticus]